MNKELINKFMNALFMKSKNNLRAGCSVKILSALLDIDNNTSQNILHYLSDKGYVDTKNNYGDSVSLTSKGIDYTEDIRKNKRYVVIKFNESIYVSPATVMRYGFLFWYDLIDEKGKIENKTIGAFASDVLSMNWGLRFDNVGINKSERILLQFAKEYIKDKILEGALVENEEFTLMTSSQPKACPYNPDNLIETKFAEFEVELNQPPNSNHKLEEVESLSGSDANIYKQQHYINIDIPKNNINHMSKPKIFIGSSTEGLNVANAVQQNLDHFAEVTIWTQGIFKLSVPTITNLIKSLNQFEYAIFIFYPDDLTILRESNVITVRDNVIFETGLFVGKLGLDKVFFLKPRSQPDLHLPTDLLGVTAGEYDANRTDQNYMAATAPFCNQVRQQIAALEKESKANQVS